MHKMLYFYSLNYCCLIKGKHFILNKYFSFITDHPKTSYHLYVHLVHLQIEGVSKCWQNKEVDLGDTKKGVGSMSGIERKDTSCG